LNNHGLVELVGQPGELVGFWAAGRVDNQIDGRMECFGGDTVVFALNNYGDLHVRSNLLVRLNLLSGANSGTITIDQNCTITLLGFGGPTGWIENTGTISGSGAIAGNLVNNGTLDPVGSLTLNGNLSGTGALLIDVAGPTDYEQIRVSGAITLGGTLDVSLGYTPALGDTFRVLDNTGTNPIMGNFQGWLEGALVAINGTNFLITYRGGTGNDVTLTRTETSPLSARVTIGDNNVSRLDSLQRSRIEKLTVTFDKVISYVGAPGDAFRLEKIVGGVPAGTVALSIDTRDMGGYSQATLTFLSDTTFGSLNDGRYRLTVLANQIVAPGAAMPADSILNFHRMFGDVNGDAQVDLADFALFSGAYGTVLGGNGYLAYFDYNRDGVIDIADFGQFSIRMFTVLP
jgi:hypothetical protein